MLRGRTEPVGGAEDGGCLRLCEGEGVARGGAERGEDGDEG